MSLTMMEPITINRHIIVPEFATTHTSQPVTVETIVFLGTASAIPTTKRNTSGLAYVLSNGSSFLLDCGEGTQTQILDDLHTGYLYGYEVRLHELDITIDTIQDCGIIGNALHVQATRIPHTEYMHAFAYTVKEQDKSGAFLLSKTQEILGGGILMSGEDGGERIKKLKNGEDVTLPDGRVLRSADCIDTVQTGAKISLVQDTYDPSVAISQLPKFGTS